MLSVVRWPTRVGRQRQAITGLTHDLRGHPFLSRATKLSMGIGHGERTSAQATFRWQVLIDKLGW